MNQVDHNAFVRSYREKQAAAGRCACSRPRAEGKKFCSSCLFSRSTASKNQREKRKKEGLCLRCGAKATDSFRTCSPCREKHTQRAARVRKEVVDHYGGKCACCSEKELSFLTIDHVNNDGAAHRKTMAGKDIAAWLKKNNFPEGFQVLCWNCNEAKRFLGVCPHKRT